MCKLIRRVQSAISVASVCIALVSVFSCASASPDLVKQEEGYYYGYGTGATVALAASEARRDLVSNALTATLRARDPKAARVTVTAEAAAARLADLKPFAETKAGQTPAVTYRIKLADWDKAEKAHADALRGELAPRVTALAGKRALAERLGEALAVLARLSDDGESALLSAEAGGSDLLSRKVEGVCAEAGKGLALSLSVKDGFADATSAFIVKAADQGGAAVANLPLAVSWDASDLPTEPGTAAVASVALSVKTDSLGNAKLEFPADAAWRNRPVTLSVTTALAAAVPGSASLKKLDAANGIEGRYIAYNDASSYYAGVTVAAGKFNAGAVAQDTRAGKKEASRAVTTGSYAIDVGPVSNARFAAFLHATRAEALPEYFDNPDYNQGNQPVVGVSYADAVAYAAWLSAQTGRVYRLPTEEEWEKAARAGKDTVYPWGDDSPADAKKANYKGNGRFAAPSPIGSFENGKNAWGLVDMAGNVWQWTSSTRAKDPESASRVVKGGSWMDGPTELRVSNYRELDGGKGYPDVGFRLVMEVSK